MPTQLEVVNQALNELGRNAVQNINDLPESQLIANKLNVLLPELLLRTDWNFAIKFVQDNNPLTTNFSPDFLYTYKLPADYNRMDRFSWLTTGQAFGFYYRILDGLVLTNAKPINYYYVVNNIDYAFLPALFYRALSLYAAAETAMAITNKAELAKYLEVKYQQKIVDAMLQNDMDRYIQSTPYNDFDRATYI